MMNKHRPAKQGARLLPFFLKRVQQLKDTPLAPLQTLAKTIVRWQEEIVRM